MLEFSKFIVDGALNREESRGGHYHEDFTTRNDGKFMKHTYAYMDKEFKMSSEWGEVTQGKFEPMVTLALGCTESEIGLKFHVQKARQIYAEVQGA